MVPDRYEVAELVAVDDGNGRGTIDNIKPPKHDFEKKQSQIGQIRSDQITSDQIRCPLHVVFIDLSRQI